jgi:hypothetical protein
VLWVIARVVSLLRSIGPLSSTATRGRQGPGAFGGAVGGAELVVRGEEVGGALGGAGVHEKAPRAVG